MSKKHKTRIDIRTERKAARAYWRQWRADQINRAALGIPLPADKVARAEELGRRLAAEYLAAPADRNYSGNLRQYDPVDDEPISLEDLADSEDKDGGSK